MAAIIGNYCYRSRILAFLKTSEADWLAIMVKNYPRVCDHELTLPQINAWKNCFNSLQGALGKLPVSFSKLQIVFEYCLPPYKKRPDVLIVGADTVVVLEFKQDMHFPDGAIRQIRKYKKLIQGYHEASRGKRKKAVLVFTDQVNLNEKKYRVICCSPDELTGILVDIFGDRPAFLTRAEAKQWVHSGFSTESTETAERMRAQTFDK